MPHEDPIVAVFAPDDMVGLFHNLEDLFVVEYLMALGIRRSLSTPAG